MSRKPVFDIGDTLMPSFRLQNELMRDELREQGAKEVPDFDVNNFRIYTISEVEDYLEKNGLTHGDPLRIIEKYKERERRFMEEKGVFEFLKAVSEEFGPVGFISDNTIEGKRWMETQLRMHNVPFSELVVSEEVGVEKPSKEIFQEFLDRKEAEGSEYTYFGNNLNRDPACRKVEMEFVLVDAFKVYGEAEEEFESIDELSVEAVKKVMSR